MTINTLAPTTLQTFNQMSSAPKQATQPTKAKTQDISQPKDTLEIKSGLGQAIKGGIAGAIVAGITTEVATTILIGKHAMGPILAAHAALPVAAAGAIVGGVIATSTDNKSFAALGGAVVGAISGAGIGMPGLVGGAIGGALAGLVGASIAERVAQ